MVHPVHVLATLFAVTPLAAAQLGPASAPPVGRTETAVLASGASSTQVSIATVTLGVKNPTPSTVLTGLTLLPIQLAQRTTLERLGPGFARVVDVGAGVTALELPGVGAARVFHYRRTGTTTFGFFSITSAGAVRVLLERTGVGSNSTLNPFDSIVAASPDGKTVAIAARKYNQGVDGLGDCWLARADGALFPSGAAAVELTGNDDVDVAPHSLTFKGGSLYASYGDALVRAPADGSAPFVTVPIPPTATASQPELIDEFAVSGDGSTIAFLAGKDEQNVDLYVIDVNGVVTNVTNAPADIQPPNYLPEETGGPLLALSDDGALIALDRELAGGHEFYVRATQPGAAELHITSDANFEHSIDTVSGVLFGTARARFFARAGNVAADLYQVELGGTLPTLSNVSQTSGVSTPFFPNAGQINPSATWALGTEQVFVDDQLATGGAIDLWRVDGAGLASVVAGGLTAKPSVTAPAGVRTHFVVRTDAPTQTALWFAMPTPGVFAPVLTLPQSVPLAAVAINRAGTRIGVAAEFPAGVRWVASIHPLTQQTTLIGGGPIPGAHDVSFSMHGRLLFTATGSGGVSQLLSADASTGTTTNVGAPAAFALWLR
jgi:hypothetical protein